VTRNLRPGVVSAAALLAALCLRPDAVGAAAEGIHFEIDPAHSSVQFKVRHLGISTVTGRFEEFSGTVVYDPEAPETSVVAVSIQVASINTDVQGRDDHLRSADFFDAANHPEMTFRSTAVRALGDGRFEVDGDLTIRGTTRPVTLESELGGMIRRQGQQGARRTVAFTGETRIKRQDFGLAWNRAWETGGFVVGDQVRILLEIEANAPEPER